MDIDKDTEKQIQELQILEQNMQGIMMQKQSLQLELTEVENSLEELKKTKDDVYKIAGQIMIKASKKDLEKELKEKQDLVSMRLKTLDTQEKTLSKSGEELRKKVLGKIQK
jgi:prefoldin beta subunit